MSERLRSFVQALAAGELAASAEPSKDGAFTLRVEFRREWVDTIIAGIKEVYPHLGKLIPPWAQAGPIRFELEFRDQDDVEDSRPVIDDEAWT